MTQLTMITRRVLLRDMGKASLALVVMGAAACSDADSSAATSTSVGADPTTSTGPTTSSTETTATTAGGAAGGGFSWERANLDFVSAYILHRNGEAVLVDTGVGGSADGIEAALGAAGLAWNAVGHVIVTHSHPDHQGSLPAVLELAGGPSWYAGTADIPNISADGGIPVGDDDQVFDLQIIETPGHTPGHIAVLDPLGGILLTGDALNGDAGGVVGPNQRFTPDMETANQSVAKLATFDYDVALFGHGEPVLENASTLVAGLAESIGG